MEIDPRQFDYANLKDLLLRGAAFAIQMREGFDPALTPTQRRNFMDRHIHMARKEIAPVFNKELTAFLGNTCRGKSSAIIWLSGRFPCRCWDFTGARRNPRPDSKPARIRLKRRFQEQEPEVMQSG